MEIFYNQISSNSRALFLVILISLFWTQLNAQVFVPSTGSNTIGCGTNTTLCDHANCSTKYSNSVDGYTVLSNPSLPITVTISGTYATEASYDFVNIYAGSGTAGALLASYSGSGTINYTGSPGQTLTVRFYSDGSVVGDGFSLSITYNGGTGYEIAAEGSTSPAVVLASACANGTVPVGSGAYRDVAITANTWYNFTAPSSFPANMNQIRAVPNGTGSGGNVILNAGGTSTAWFSGTSTSMRVSTNRTSCTWVATSATLTYRHTQPTSMTATASSTSPCTGTNITLTGAGTYVGSWAWSGGPTGTYSPGNTSQSPTWTATSGSGAFTLTGSNNGCTNTATTASVSVGANRTVGAASSSPTPCINTVMTSITHATTNVTGIASSTGLPAGVTAAYASNVITISGTPSASGTFNYTITPTGCGSATATGTITVGPNRTVGAASSSPTPCINTVMTSITHATTNVTGIASSTGLPAGVTAAYASNVITISGTPSASGTFNYTITPTGCGSATATGTITVGPNRTVGAASSSPTPCINTVMTSITHRHNWRNGYCFEHRFTSRRNGSICFKM
jgi:hypothetical protein